MEHQSAVDYFGGEELPAQVWTDKYGLRDKNEKLLETTPDDMHWRIARELARVEKHKFKKPLTTDEIYGYLKGFGLIIPQGSPMYGIGNPQYITLSNCYVVDPPLDSYGGIHHTDEQLTQLCKRRGGVGTDVSHIRPDNIPTTNAARKATGVVSFCERFSNSIREVGQNGRRGALMLTLSVHHPQVEDFATMKLDRKKVTGANVSVRLTDEFMNAVKNGEAYEQRWPVNAKNPTISRKVDARKVWQTIIRCAHEAAEPGLLFWDHILRESPADCYAALGFRTVSTNPCSELPLCVLDSCRLLLVNLFALVSKPFTRDASFNLDRLYEVAQVAQRLMDDLVDLELEAIRRIIEKVRTDPEPGHVKQRELQMWLAIREKCTMGRRTGTGITALGDTMAALGIKYGSEESIEFTEKVYRALKLGCYRASVDMAKELGPFPIWAAKLEENCPFLLRIKSEDPALYREMQIVGRRNIALLTTAPAGSVSILAGPGPYYGTTSGIEPLYTDVPYTRRKKIVPGMDGVRVDSVDEMGDSWQHFEVIHPKLKLWMDVTGNTDWRKSPYHGCTANDLDWKQRVRLQAVAQRHVDHAISSTLNLPNDVTQDQVAEIYQTLWEAGCKGGTVYRDGCRDGVLVKEHKGIKKTEALTRPPELFGDIYRIKVKGEPFAVVVGLFCGDPYEVFAFKNNDLLQGDSQTGLIRKVKRGEYKLWASDGITSLLPPKTSLSSLLTDTEEALTRMVSTALRHGADVAFVVDQLGKVRGDLYSFAKALSRTLKKYIPEGKVVVGVTCDQCGCDAIRYQEGCQTCSGCGASKCG